MKDFFRHNRKAAVAGLILMIVFSLVFGVNRSIDRLANKVEKLYLSSDTKYGSVQKDIRKFYGYLNEMYSEASEYGDNIALGCAVAELKNSIDSPYSIGKIVQSAYETAQITYNRLMNTDDISENDKKNIIVCFSELQALSMRLKNNEDYNEAAKAYNKALNSFPAVIFDLIHIPAVVFE